MVRTPPTKKRVLIGIALIAIGLTILGLVPMDLRDIFLFSLAIFASVVTMGLGIALIGSMPMKTVLAGLLIGGLWIFLFDVPIILMGPPLEVLAIVLGWSSIVPVVTVGLFQRWMKNRKRTQQGVGQIENAVD
jgi:hypothetical protein